MKQAARLVPVGLFIATLGFTCDNTAPPPDTCVTGLTLTIGTPTTGAVAGGDCALPDGEGRHGDSYAFSVETQTIVRFNISGTTETAIRIRDNGMTGEQDVAIHDNGLSEYQTFVVLKPGSYTLDIAADEDDASGDYTIASTVLTAPQPTGCIQPPNQWRFAAVGVTVSGEITGTDCAGSGAGRVDNFNVKMFSGGPRKITVTVSAAGAAVEVRLMDSPSLVTTPMARGNAGDIVVQFSPSSTDYYNIAIISTPGASPTTYTIKFE